MTMTLQLFGTPKIDSGDGAVALPFERRYQVLVFLALKRVRVSRAERSAMLWPDRTRLQMPQ